MSVKILHDVTETVKNEILKFADGQPINDSDVFSLAVYVSSKVINQFGLRSRMNVEAFGKLVLNQVNKENALLGA